MFDIIDNNSNYFNRQDLCSYYDMQNFNNSFSNRQNSLILVNYNIRSVIKNSDDFFAFVGSLNTKVQIIVLTETWMNDSGDWLNIPGFTAYHSVRMGKRGGGVTVLVSTALCSFSMPDCER